MNWFAKLIVSWGWLLILVSTAVAIYQCSGPTPL